MRTIHSTALILGALLVSGCAFQKQAVRLQPSVEVQSSNVGAGKLVMVSVSDERPRSTLGTRGAGGIGEQITVDGDIATTIKAAVTEGLLRQGFRANGPLENQLRVEIRNLDYSVNTGFWAGKLNIEFLLKGICVKGDSRPYEQVYRGEFRRNVQVVQGEKDNTTFINEAVSGSVNALLNDADMIRCLAQ